jgi:hypothetical protein
MKSGLLRAAAFALALGAMALGGCQRSPPAVESPQSVVEVRADVSAATGYPGASLELAASPAQITVTIINSPMAARTAIERQADAQRVVFAIANSIKDRPEFSAVHTVHVDYVTASSNGGARKPAGGFDFRKNPQGVFQLHLT